MSKYADNLDENDRDVLDRFVDYPEKPRVSKTPKACKWGRCNGTRLGYGFACSRCGSK